MSNPKSILNNLLEDCLSYKDNKKTIILESFFKTAPGEYGHKDKFLGISVPKCRKLSKKYSSVNLSQASTLIRSKYHEIRLIGLLILIVKFKHQPKHVFNLYLRSIKFVNNWDLVDLSAPKILGAYLLMQGDWQLLKKLAKSSSLWEKRIAIVATNAFIRSSNHLPTFEIADLLMKDSHDLIHKAVGWMLREVGKHIDHKLLTDYLKSRYRSMPRTMLRYAIERFPQHLRLQYLKGEI